MVKALKYKIIFNPLAVRLFEIRLVSAKNRSPIQKGVSSPLYKINGVSLVCKALLYSVSFLDIYGGTTEAKEYP